MGFACAVAVVSSGVEGADEREVTRVMSAIADRVVHEFVEPFTFPNQHQRILEPYNYYEFGQVFLILHPHASNVFARNCSFYEDLTHKVEQCRNSRAPANAVTSTSLKPLGRRPTALQRQFLFWSLMKGSI